MLRLICILACLCAPPLAQDAAPFATYMSASDAILNDPHDLTFGPDGRLYVADKFANRVAIMDPETLELVGSIGDNEVPGAQAVVRGFGIRHFVRA